VKTILISILNEVILGLFEESRVIICHCRGVSDREIRRAIREGATSTREVAQACKASRGCGGCRPAIAEILASEVQQTAAAAQPLATPLAAFSAGG
jgi:NAD(P)H-nitrite reductase large subunit